MPGTVQGMLRAGFVAGLGSDRLLDLDGAAWARARAERIPLVGTPLGLQPSRAIRASWEGKRIGAVDRVDVAALHDETVLALRLEWADASEDRAILDTTMFPDGAAVAFPVSPQAPLLTMGSPDAAVNAWHWRADEGDRGRDVVAHGLGTSRAVDLERVRVRATWKDGRWRVAIARALRVPGQPVAQLRPGMTRFGVAIWEGGRAERGGIKAFSGDWRELAIEPAG